ncbi:SRPBCC family protein [Hydrogenophaga sp. PAMC20947]|uniref:SRPBCC family protein n=1 Tax=Hydrogenophaga sp. PAMC20947 TaxID=2565558 RepID=UPI00109E2041|nr:SRPBCC family protein [Hydrogenophaga sp. PAMC20947]QCB48121.1 polyketide cyclase [Hydrogenophaga sp. PAMC20947]
MIKTIALLLVLTVLALLAYAATRPDTFAVERSVTIAAPAEKLFPLINDMRSFNTWNPYNRKDPAMKGIYSGPQAGAGAAFDFHGNKGAGKGRLAITGTTEVSRVSMQLDMEEPFEGHNAIDFTLAPESDGTTRVTWSMHGPSSFLPKLMGIFFNMDQMIGKDFETGLANLKVLAEKP